MNTIRKLTQLHTSKKNRPVRHDVTHSIAFNNLKGKFIMTTIAKLLKLKATSDCAYERCVG